MFSLKSISLAFGGIDVLKDVSLSLQAGERVGLCGVNGSGKSSLINVATGFQPPVKGDIALDDTSLLGLEAWAFARHGIVRTFQSSRLLTSVALREQLGISDAAQERAADMIGGTALEPYMDAFAEEIPLSGLRQFEVIRALAQQPKVMFLDEPSAGLTSSEVTSLADLLQKWLTPLCTLVIVEHRHSFMRRMAEKVFELKHGSLSPAHHSELTHA